MDRRRDLEEGEPGPLVVAVEEDDLALLRAALGRGLRPLAGQDHHRAWAPADQRVLPALAVAGVVGEGSVGLGHPAVVLADAPPHLGDQGSAQGLGAGERAFRIGVLGLQMRPDVRRQGRRVLEHVAPVRGLQPSVIVREVMPVDGLPVRPHLGDRRRQRDCDGSGVGRHGDTSWKRGKTRIVGAMVPCGGHHLNRRAAGSVRPARPDPARRAGCAACLPGRQDHHAGKIDGETGPRGATPGPLPNDPEIFFSTVFPSYPKMLGSDLRPHREYHS